MTIVLPSFGSQLPVPPRDFIFLWRREINRFIQHVSWNYLPKQTNNKEKRERNILALNTRLQQILSSPRTERDIKKKLQLHLYLFGNCMNLVTFQLVIFVFECRLHHQYICCSFQNVVNIWVPHSHSTVTDQKKEF